MSKRVVVTGCFQLLHKGHLNLLERAAKYGNVHVLLNSDQGVLKLKEYLAEPFELRKANLLKTGLVKQVYRFFTDPTSWLSLLNPDILVVGSDHTKEEVLQKGGAYAGKIVVLPYTQGICSTDLYKRSKE